jgi:hypothetical protein
MHHSRRCEVCPESIRHGRGPPWPSSFCGEGRRSDLNMVVEMSVMPTRGGVVGAGGGASSWGR